jgi:CRISPR/Cas system-associated exonuclease Cas4 (RecB family)
MAIQLKPDKSFTERLQSNLKARYESRRRTDDNSNSNNGKNRVIHVSDILPSGCMRKQYYSRKIGEPLTNESVHAFVRGEASEHIITKLVNMGVAQVPIEMDGIVGHPDLMVVKSKGNNNHQGQQQKHDTDKEEPIIIELKDTVSNKRLDFNDDLFRSYLRQLLYYLVMSEIEFGIISIRYNAKELVWIKRDNEGDHYLRPYDAKGVGIESWSVYLPLNDMVRDLIKDEMIERKELFLKALQDNEVKHLPRMTGTNKIIKCKHCVFYDTCWNKDVESIKAIQMGTQKDLLDMVGVVSIEDDGVTNKDNSKANKINITSTILQSNVTASKENVIKTI